MENKRYLWVIGGGLLQVPLIEEAKKLSLNVIVSDFDDQCKCKEKADIFVNIDIFDIDSHLFEAKNLVKKGVNIVGVLAAGIDAPETMAALSKALNLKSVDLEIATIVHNKHLFRDKLLELGYPVPKYKSISNDDLPFLADIIDEIGFPLIVKNTDSSGSRGTKIFYENNFEEIKIMVQEAMNVSKSEIALIEECWEGPEQTVETLFDINGKFHSCFITDRIFDKSNGFAMEVGLRHPSKLPINIQEEMFDLAKRVSLDFGVKVGASKFDMILTKNGPRIIEMTVRLSGGFDSQYLVPISTGKNILRCAILTSIGDIFSENLLIDTKNKIGLSESLWPIPGKIVSIDGVDEALKIPGVEYIFFRNKVGDIIDSYNDCTKRVCFILVAGSTEEMAREIMNQAKEKIKIKTINN